MDEIFVHKPLKPQKKYRINPNIICQTKLMCCKWRSYLNYDIYRIAECNIIKNQTFGKYFIAYNN